MQLFNNIFALNKISNLEKNMFEKDTRKLQNSHQCSKQSWKIIKKLFFIMFYKQILMYFASTIALHKWLNKYYKYLLNYSSHATSYGSL